MSLTGSHLRGGPRWLVAIGGWPGDAHCRFASKAAHARRSAKRETRACCQWALNRSVVVGYLAIQVGVGSLTLDGDKF